MNRQQAINYLLSSGFSEEQINTIEQAFKQEPTSNNDLGVDCISRADLYNRIKKIDHDEDYECDEFGGSKITYHTCDWDEVLREIEDAPSVTPQEPRWIPVSERLPEEPIIADGYIEPSDYVLVQMKSGLMHVTRYWGNRQCMAYEDWLDLHYPTTDEVIAWMPLPKLYEPQESEVEDGKN